MYIVKVKGGQFDVIDQVPADKALGPDVCARF
jgi:hypothetical protein